MRASGQQIQLSCSTNTHTQHASYVLPPLGLSLIPAAAGFFYLDATSGLLSTRRFRCRVNPNSGELEIQVSWYTNGLNPLCIAPRLLRTFHPSCYESIRFKWHRMTRRVSGAKTHTLPSFDSISSELIFEYAHTTRPLYIAIFLTKNHPSIMLRILPIQLMTEWRAERVGRKFNWVVKRIRTHNTPLMYRHLSWVKPIYIYICIYIYIYIYIYTYIHIHI